MIHDLTKEERNAIRSLRALAKRWPQSLWVFAGASQDGLSVMRCKEDGTKAVTGDGRGYEQGYFVELVRIPSDGGDF